MGFDPDLLKEIDAVIDKYIDAHDELERIWAQKIVFSAHWWIDVSLAVLPWVVWFIVRDRKRTHSLLYAGLFSMLIATLFNMAGVSQNGWNYNTLLLPYFPEYLPWDLTVMPVMVMLFYQYFPKINPWIKGAAFAAVASYVVEPVFVWLNIYEQSSWEHYFSLPIYFPIYMAGYWLYTRKSKEDRGHSNA